MKKILKYKRIYLLVLFPVSLLLLLAAKQSSFFAEQIYAKHIYKFISQIISTITGMVPFSIAEILIILLPAAAIAITIRFIVLLIADKNNRIERLIRGILNLCCTISVILFMFLIQGGLNYYRYPFSTYSDLKIENSSINELYALTHSLVDTADQLREQVPKTDKNGVFKLSCDN
jgi:NADH:ubiquinone oxidoreductase subunit 6 (subunit J)